MRNHGIAHGELQWHDNGNGTGLWVIHVRCELFGSVKVNIPSRRSEGLTPTQERCLQLVRSLTPDKRGALTEALRQYAITHTGDEPDDDDLRFSCDNASVPYLEHADTPYVYLNADSPIDEEHGVCFLIRDGEVLCCCHGDESLEFNDWDDTDLLDELAGGVT